MADDSHHSLPVVEFITGFFIAINLVSIPFIIHFDSRVKSLQDNSSVKWAGEPKTGHIQKRQIYAA